MSKENFITEVEELEHAYNELAVKISIDCKGCFDGAIMIQLNKRYADLRKELVNVLNLHPE